MEKLIITVLGQDRPGIIAKTAGSLFELDCNVENVSQMVLQAEFAAFFVVESKKSLSEIQDKLKRDLKDMQLDVHVKPLALSSPVAEVRSRPFIITTTGPDSKGLVAKITGILAQYKANITNLKAVFLGGNDPDKNIMVYEVDLPEKTDRSALNQALKEKGKELGLTVSMQHKNIFDVVNKI